MDKRVDKKQKKVYIMGPKRTMKKMMMMVMMMIAYYMKCLYNANETIDDFTMCV